MERVREVSGYDESFEQAVEEGLVPSPPLATWNGWQRWRREHGRRPNEAEDGFVPRPRDEVALWRRAMAHFHGPDWATQVAPRGPGDVRIEYPDGARGPEDRAAPSQPASGAAPGAGPPEEAAGAVMVPVVAMTPEAPQELSSEASSRLPTPRTLLARLEQEYQPAEEQLAEYQTRLRRVLDACCLAGIDVDYEKLERRLIRAEFLDQIKAARPEDAANELRSLAVARLSTELPGSPESRARTELETEVLVEMLRERGVTASARPERLFSGASTPAPQAPSPPRRLFGSEPGTTEVAGLPAVPEMPGAVSGAQQQGSESEPSWLRPLLETISAKDGQQPVHRGATIRINPTVKWPTLGGDDQDVEEFFEQFEELCGLANDGLGMSDKEKLKVLLSCLRGTREKTYRVIHKLNRANGRVASDPRGVFEDIKARLMRFVETSVEKQSRILAAWSDCKGVINNCSAHPIGRGGGVTPLCKTTKMASPRSHFGSSLAHLLSSCRPSQSG